ncbi:hypothetical protein BJ944DRAFT_288985 [Cunninghamella echinulata]|nr:hypothetical protein BJ944DRAFT_288985 [Cunninghamella echinulata]
MEACVLNQPLQQTINNNTIEIPSTHLSIQDEPLATKTTLKRSGTSLSDLIPKAAAALKTQQLLRLQQQQQQTSFQDPTLPTPTTTFGRALTKVKLQIQTKRLKERYLSHEWIRLALSLPVDTSHINLHHYYYQKEEKSSIPVTAKETKGENEEEQDIVKNNIEEEKHNPSSFIKNETPMSPPFTTISSLSTTTTTTTTITNTNTSCQNDHPILHSMVSPPSSPKPAFINDHHDSVEANKNGQNHDQTILSPTISTELSLLKEEKQEKGKKNQHYDNSSNNNNNNNKKNGTYYYHCNIVIPKVPTSRTEEIVTWYEWKLNKTKFSIDEIESKVDQLRKVKLQDKLA